MNSFDDWPIGNDFYQLTSAIDMFYRNDGVFDSFIKHVCNLSLLEVPKYSQNFIDNIREKATSLLYTSYGNCLVTCRGLYSGPSHNWEFDRFRIVIAEDDMLAKAILVLRTK